MNATVINNIQGTVKKRPLPSFIKKLWFILDDTPSHEHIFWVDNGQVICVPNASTFSKIVLPRFFKHSNWQSFVRQLNLYGFRKVYQLNLSYDESNEKRTVWQFKHECFRKDNSEKLCEIKRRASKSSNTAPNSLQNSSSMNTILLSNTNYSNQFEDFNIRNENIDEQLKAFEKRLQNVNKKRKLLWEQTVKLNQIQQRQQETIRVLMDFMMQFLDSQPDSESDKLRFASIIKKVTDQSKMDCTDQFMRNYIEEVDELQDEDDDDEDDEESGSSSSSYSLSSSLPHHMISRIDRQALPSIATLLTDHSSDILPPLRKRRV